MSDRCNLRILIFHPALAPYRVDFFNEISKKATVNVFFLNENVLEQKFDQAILRKNLICDYGYLLTGFNIHKRIFRWGALNIIFRYKPHVVVCSEFSPLTLWLSLVKKFFIPRRWKLCVWTDENIVMLGKDKAIRRLIKKFVLSSIDGLFVCSEKVKWFYSKIGIPEHSIGVSPIIRNELNFRRVLPRTQLLAREKQKSIKLSNKKVVLFVGRIVKAKGIDRLIKAFAEASRKTPDLALVIVGDGPELKNLRALTILEGVCDNVIFTGRLEGPDLLSWYLVSDLFVLASHHEPFGAVVNESLLSGTPVLCSKNAGAADLILPGKNGFVFDPFDIDELTRLIVHFFNNMPIGKKNDKIVQNLTPFYFEDSVQNFINAAKKISASF